MWEGGVEPDTELKIFFFHQAALSLPRSQWKQHILCLKPEQWSGLSKVGLDRP